MFANPTLYAATWHYRVFVISRFCHTVVYLMALPQPSRALAYVVGAVTTVSMAVQILMAIAHF